MTRDDNVEFASATPNSRARRRIRGAELKSKGTRAEAPFIASVSHEHAPTINHNTDKAKP